jgi:hypothetical protein
MDLEDLCLINETNKQINKIKKIYILNIKIKQHNNINDGWFITISC